MNAYDIQQNKVGQVGEEMMRRVVIIHGLQIAKLPHDDWSQWLQELVQQLRRQAAKHQQRHSELGAVLSQHGAQSPGCAYDTEERSEEAAPAWLRPHLDANRILWSAGMPGYIRAVLASDGWWWEIV